MKHWVRGHPLSSYFFVAYAVSWSIAVPLALQAQGFVFQRLPWSLHYLTAFGPAVAALLIARLLRQPAAAAERAERRPLARGIFWWTIGFGSPLLLFVIALVTASPNAGGLIAAVTSTLVMVWAVVVLWRCDWATLASSPRSVRATREEKTRALPGDERIPEAIDTLTHGVTIRRAPRDVWPWLAQMGAGSRAGWYSYDWLDNGRQPSATRIVPELQHPLAGTIFPALPGVTEGFVVLAIEPERVLMLAWPPNEVTWTFCLDEVAPGVTRLLVRARGGPGYRFHGLPLLLTRVVVRVVHFIMQRKQLLGIAKRAETAMSHDERVRGPASPSELTDLLHLPAAR